MNDLLPDSYPTLLDEIKTRIQKTQYDALKAVNKELMALYWDIGRMIVERQEGDSWGKAVAEQLAKDLQAEFPGMSGFSRRNIFYMREFYLCYRGQEKEQRLVAQIGWSQLDDVAREEGENPSIGMILCKTKNRTTVEYALRESNKPIGVSQYRMVSNLPADMKGQLPDPEQIAKLLENL